MKASDYEPAPRDSPWCYPGRIPSTSFGFDGGVHLVDEKSAIGELERWLESHQSLGLGARLPVLCSGSNANPAQIARKTEGLLGDRCTPFLLVQVSGIHAVYAATVAAYGAVPATLDAASSSARLHLGLYTAAQLGAVLPTETPEYVLAKLEVPIILPDSRTLPGAYAFMSVVGVLSFDGDAAVPLSSLPEPGLVKRLFARIVGAPGVPSLDEYLAQPRLFRRAVLEAIEQQGLYRRARVPYREATPESLLTLEHWYG